MNDCHCGNPYARPHDRGWPCVPPRTPEPYTPLPTCGGDLQSLSEYFRRRIDELARVKVDKSKFDLSTVSELTDQDSLRAVKNAFNNLLRELKGISR